MSIKLMSEVWGRELETSDQAVLLAMADHAHDDGSKCFPSVGLLAWKTGLSERTVQYIIRRFIDAGVLILVKAQRQHQPNEYKIELSKLPAKSPYVPKRKESRGATIAPLDDDQEPPNNVPGVQNKTSGVQNNVPGVQNEAPRGATAIAPEPLTIIEPSLEPSRASARDAAVEQLERFFSATARIPLPARNTDSQKKAAGKRWWNPMVDLWKLCNHDTTLAENLMRRAITKMRRDKLTVSAPASIYEVAMGLYGEDHATTVQHSYPEGAELERRRRAVEQAGTFADAEPG